MVNIVDIDLNGNFLAVTLTGDAALLSVQGAQVVNHLSDVVLAEYRCLGRIKRNIYTELTVHLVTANLRQIIAARGEVHVVEQRLCGLHRRGLARAELTVDIEQSLVPG